MNDTAQQNGVPLFTRIRNTIRSVFGVLSWLVPVGIIAIGHFYFPRTRETVTWPQNVEDGVWGGVAVLIIITMCWVVLEMWYAVNQRTSTPRLMADHLISVTSALVFVAVGAYWASRGISWNFLVPAVGVVFEALISGVFALNNAAQKPFGQSPLRG